MKRKPKRLVISAAQKAKWRKAVAEQEARRRDGERNLLSNMRRQRKELTKLLSEGNGHWGYEDGVYRFYHQSYKVFFQQEATVAMVDRLRSLLPGHDLNPWFLEIVKQGTGRTFQKEHNEMWLTVTRPMIEAYFHARYFVAMAVRYSKLRKPPRPLPSGYAALLYLFNMR